MSTLVAHGGAGNWDDCDEDSIKQSIGEALSRGLSAMDTGSSLKAVVETVKYLEDDPQFNSGTGACLDFKGHVTMDAAVMKGNDLKAGAVANIRDVRHPISVARDVMESTDHVLLGGEGAVEFAHLMGHEPFDPITEDRRSQYNSRKQQFLDGESSVSLPKLKRLTEEHPELLGGTVGAVAVDSNGQPAAATSTGGVFLKWPGRIGDSPLIGSGTYASPDVAVSATGRGESIIRFSLARRIAEEVARGSNLSDGSNRVLHKMSEVIGDYVGLIAVDAGGDIGVNHLTERMPHGLITSEGRREIALSTD